MHVGATESRGGPDRRSRRGPGLALLVVLIGALTATFPCAALAATRSVPATRTAITTVTVEGYDVDFTLPTASKVGCLVCHGDVDLSRLKESRLISYYVAPEIVAISAHASVQCTGCHLDFAYTTPHTPATDWQRAAKSDCKNCHKDQFIPYGRGAHRIEVLPGGAADAKENEKPLCGDCHGSHEIAALTDNPTGQKELHARGWFVCGRCHKEYWDNYSDYYHGAAYLKGAPDAPACWDCHGAHEILPADDVDSTVNERHLAETCGQCHPDVNETYIAYAGFIHRRAEVSSEVIFYRLYLRLRESLAGLFASTG